LYQDEDSHYNDLNSWFFLNKKAECLVSTCEGIFLAYSKEKIACVVEV